MGVGTASPLEERDHEVALLDALLRRALDGQGALAVVEGPAGIGKTRLLRELRDRAAALGAPVLSARAGEGERDFAFGVVRQLVERRVLGASADEQASLLRGAAGLAAPLLGLGTRPDVPSVDAPDPSFAALHGLYWLTSELAAAGGLVLAVDDAHWADAPSLRFLRYLARRLDGLPVLVAVGLRPDGAEAAERELLAGLAAEPDALVLRPGTLSAAAVGRLAADAFGRAADGAFAAAVHEAAGGVPFYVTALLAALRDADVEPVAAGCGQVRGLGPPTVRRSVLLRLAGLPPAAVGLVRAVAVLGTDATSPRSAALAALASTEAAVALDALVGAGLVVGGGERPVAFAHPIVGAAVAGELGPGERAQLHARAARLLRDEGADAGRIAPHLLHAPPAGEAWVVDVLRAGAAAASSRGAPEIAVRALRRALEEPPAAGVRDAVLGELGAAELRAGDPAAAGHLRAAIRATANQDGDGAVGTGRGPAARAADAQLLGRALAAAGRAAEAVELLGGLADELRDQDADAARLLDGDLAAIALLDPRLAHTAQERIERHADVTGATRAERLVLVSLAQRAWVQGRGARATRELAERALAGGRLLAEETTDSVAFGQAVFALLVGDGLDSALGHLGAAARDAERRGSIYGYASVQMLTAVAQLRGGDVLAAEARARAGVEAGDHAFVSPSARGFLAIALVERDQLDAAEQVVFGPEVPAVLPASMPSIHLAFARGIVHLRRGRFAEAVTALEDCGDREAAFGITAPVTTWRLLLAGAVARRGDLASAKALVDEQERLAAAWGAPSVLAQARRAQAMWQAPAPQRVAFEQALLLSRAGVDRLDLARGLVDLGAHLRRANERVAARAPLTEALDLATRLGARALAEKAHKELQVAGAKPRRLQFSGLEALTAAERRVVELAAKGRSNREIAESLFVTAKTVENHLGRAYRKLGVQSREELGDVLGGSPPQN